MLNNGRTYLMIYCQQGHSTILQYANTHKVIILLHSNIAFTYFREWSLVEAPELKMGGLVFY